MVRVLIAPVLGHCLLLSHTDNVSYAVINVICLITTILALGFYKGLYIEHTHLSVFSASP